MARNVSTEIPRLPCRAPGWSWLGLPTSDPDPPAGGPSNPATTCPNAKPIWEKLLNKSLAAMLSAIEVYNKPDFQYREEVFVILATNAWELLTKAKLVHDAGDNPSVLHVVDKDGKARLSRSGCPLTIELTRAMTAVGLDPVVADNLHALIEIRDAAIHYYNDRVLAYVLFVLGSACLKNYQLLVNRWFDRSLMDYRFYILPLAFAYDFKTLSVLELETREGVVATIIRAVAERQRQTAEHESDFYFTCELATNFVAAKKLVAGDADATVAVGTGAAGAGPAVVFKTQRSIDKYPLSYSEVLDRVRQARPAARAPQIERAMRELNVKNNPQYSVPNFRTKAHEIRFEKTHQLPKNVALIYNEDAVRVLVEHL